MIAGIRRVLAIREGIENDFPNLRQSKWYLTSPPTFDYRCIAWAACESHRNWWPMDFPRDLYPPEVYWPPHLPVGDDSVPNFVNAFVDEKGYRPCGRNTAFEIGYQKVAIYAKYENGSLATKHMARQHFLGLGWLSKLGPNEDILHRKPRDVEGDLYGNVEQVLKRDWITAVSKGLALRSSWRFLVHRLKHPSWLFANLIAFLSL
jgi:hypothetical protein